MKTLSPSGFFVIDKPKGLTSHNVVLEVRRHLNIQKVGHLGTLDPIATGVLPVALGKGTRLVELLKGGLKIYEGSLQLGVATDTYDRTGRPIEVLAVPQLSADQIDQLAVEMGGDQWQTPPPFSSKRIGGVRAYRLARQGVEISVPPQRIRIEKMELRLVETERLDFVIHCSAGTYVRSVVHDLGIRLGCGAHLTSLRRTVSGEFSETDSLTLQQFLAKEPMELAQRMIRLDQVLLHYPRLEVDSETCEAIAHGKVFEATTSHELKGGTDEALFFRVIAPTGRLIAMARRRAAGNSIIPNLFHAFLVLDRIHEDSSA